MARLILSLVALATALVGGYFLIVHNEIYRQADLGTLLPYHALGAGLFLTAWFVGGFGVVLAYRSLRQPGAKAGLLGSVMVLAVVVAASAVTFYVVGSARSMAVLPGTELASGTASAEQAGRG